MTTASFRLIVFGDNYNYIIRLPAPGVNTFGTTNMGMSLYPISAVSVNASNARL